MLCDLCGKNEASIHINEIIGNEKKSLNICNECADKQKKEGNFKFGELDLTEVLFNLEKLKQMNKLGGPNGPVQEIATAVCPVCGWTLQKIRESGGLLGCAHCYNTFADPICEAIGNVHRGKYHVGKRPEHFQSNTPDAMQSELLQLKNTLDQLIRSEKYEDAAMVRDKIRELSRKLEAPGAAESQKGAQ